MVASVRTALRSPHGWRFLALVLVLVTALVSGIAVVGANSIAPARAAEPAAEILHVDRSVPFTALERSERMLTAIESAQLAQLLAVRQAKAAQVANTRARIVSIARKQIGDRYSAGRSGPNAFDCSGLTRYVYKKATGKELPHYSGAQYQRVKKISRKNARPGDLVFFMRNGAHHVGIYIGKGRMIDAAGYRDGVRISPISGSWWSRTYSGMGRILPS